MHAEGAGLVARHAASSGVARLVQISAIGADPGSRSRYARSKAEGEQAVRAAFAQATIMRPSIVFGPEDQFFNRFATMAQWFPFLPVIAGNTKFQPVYVGDVADAIMAALLRAEVTNGTYELGGPQIFTFRQLMAWILREIRRNRRLIELPMGLARLQATLLERLPGKLLTRDQLILLSRDNVTTPGMPGFAELGIIPTAVELVVPNYLQRFRPGGGRRERYAS